MRCCPGEPVVVPLSGSSIVVPGGAWPPTSEPTSELPVAAGGADSIPSCPYTIAPAWVRAGTARASASFVPLPSDAFAAPCNTGKCPSAAPKESSRRAPGASVAAASSGDNSATSSQGA